MIRLGFATVNLAVILDCTTIILEDKDEKTNAVRWFTIFTPSD